MEFRGEEIVMWHCGEEVGDACDGGVSEERETFVPNGGVCNEDVAEVVSGTFGSRVEWLW